MGEDDLCALAPTATAILGVVLALGTFLSFFPQVQFYLFFSFFSFFKKRKVVNFQKKKKNQKKKKKKKFLSKFPFFRRRFQKLLIFQKKMYDSMFDLWSGRAVRVSLSVLFWFSISLLIWQLLALFFFNGICFCVVLIWFAFLFSFLFFFDWERERGEREEREREREDMWAQYLRFFAEFLGLQQPFALFLSTLSTVVCCVSSLHPCSVLFSQKCIIIVKRKRNSFTKRVIPTSWRCRIK